MALGWAIACRLALAPGGWQISAVAGCDVRSVTVRPILADEVGRFNALAGRSSLARASADRAGAALRRGPGRRVGRAGRVRVRRAVVRSPGPLPRAELGGAVRAAAPCREQPALNRPTSSARIGRTVTDRTSQPATAEIYQPRGADASRHAIAHLKAMITQLCRFAAALPWTWTTSARCSIG